ncbi:MAG: CHAT domain-containing protein [Proteobacteria bacterium]|nr:CHAT domain-containing protein [Pseudomonadota bacterium]
MPSAVRPSSVMSAARSTALVLAVLLGLAGGPTAARAQAEGDDEAATSAAEPPDADAARLSRDEAARVLEQALPADADARYALLQRQYRAALRLEQRSRVLELARSLADAGRGRPGGDEWVRRYLNAEFTWGSQGRAMEAAEPFVNDRSLSPAARALVALRQTYFAAQQRDRARLLRLWGRADALSREAMQAAGGTPPADLAIERLQVQSEVQANGGDLAGAVASLRQAVGQSRRLLQALRERGTAPGTPALIDAIGWLDGSQGMLVYALVREGRSQEAIEIARSNLAAWRNGQSSDALGARWQYRLATGLVATQQYEAGLAAARESDAALARVGSDVNSHTRWLARQEVVRALIGLRRWSEADQVYRAYLAEMSADALARNRAADSRLLALLAAKNGRLDEAAEQAERLHRGRARLYGAEHPLTQEAAGVRAVVRLRRGETAAALADYESLFAATLDTPGGWRDLDERGLRGFVLGIAFDEYLQVQIEALRQGRPPPPAQAERALQIADRLSLGATQRAITDSTARVLAGTPALRSLLEQEQAQRQAVAQSFRRLNAALAEQDRLGRETRAEGFKALPEAERKAVQEQWRRARDEARALQAEAAAGRQALEGQRGAIAAQFPAYADLVTPTTPRADALRRLLLPGEGLLLVHPAETHTLLWLLAADGPLRMAISPLGAAALGERVAALRRMLDIGEQPAAQRPPLQPAALHAFYRELLGPLDGALREVKSLIVASNGALASLPLAVLVTEPPAAGAAPAWLLRRMPVTQLPSAAALLALRRGAAPPAAAKALLGFGDPQFDAAAGRPAAAAGGRTVGATATRYDAEWGFRYADIPPLPETRAELIAVADALGADPAADLLLGAKATRAAVLGTPLIDRRVLAFATHGLMPGEQPGISRPALAMAATGQDGESPLLELDDVLTLRLNAQWVLLSACNTAAGEQGGAAMSGLVRGFFFAGARSVLATHWAVDSASAAQLSAGTFRQHARGGSSRADSLRQAQLAMIDGGLGDGRWSHPFYWAPYALFGDPAR